jgi:hypothetical protein
VSPLRARESRMQAIKPTRLPADDTKMLLLAMYYFFGELDSDP